MNRRSNAQDNEVKATSVRPKRVPIGMRPKLAVFGKDPNYEYRIVNDDPGRIALMQSQGWQLCTNEEVDTGNFRAEQASEVGSLAYHIVDSKTGLKGYVMKITKDEFQEIQDAYDAEARAMEETLRPNYNDGEYGNITIDRSGRR
jgi:hypothetical protein